MRGKAIRRTREPWRSVYLFMVKVKPWRNPHQRRPMKIMPSTPMVPRPVRGPGKAKEKDQLDEAEREGEQAGGIQSGGRDLDAEEVERYAVEHPGETPRDEEKTQARGSKNGAADEPEDKPADKYICVPPLPLGLDNNPQEIGDRAPKTPELPLPSAGSEQVLDDSAVEERRSKASRTDRTESPCPALCWRCAGGERIGSG